MDTITNFFQQAWVKDLITLASVLAAILAWVAKLRWSKEYSDAKNATLNAKDEQIKTKQAYVELVERENRSLQGQTPEKLLERYKAIQKQLEEALEKVGNQLDAAKAELQTKDNVLESTTQREVNLRKDIELMHDQVKKLKRELAETQSAQASAKRLTMFPLDLGEDAFQKRIYKYNLDVSGEHIDHEDRYTPYPDEFTTENMVEWFLENYKDPVDGVPFDEGEYVYVYGGPYHADEELWAHFPDAKEDDIKKAVDEIEKDGSINWVKQWQY